MKTSSRKRIGAWSYLATLSSVHFVFIILQLSAIFDLPLNQMFIIQMTSLVIVFISSGVLFVKNNNEPVAQAFRILIITVTQLLGYLSACLALIYTDQSTEMVLYLLALALSVLILQTSYLVRRLK